MKRNLIVILTILACSLVACKPGQKKDGNMEKETKLITLSNLRRKVPMKALCFTASSRIS